MSIGGKSVHTLIVQDRVTVDPVPPRLNASSLHMSDASTYTESKRRIFLVILDATLFHYSLLCSPEFVPQIPGGALLPGALTVKTSVWH